MNHQELQSIEFQPNFEQKENALNGINAFRQTIGLPESPLVHLNDLRATRLKKTHQHNQQLIDEVSANPSIGMFQARKEHQLLRQRNFTYRSQSALFPLERLQRAKAITTMKLRGVDRPGELISILERNGSELAFNIASNSYIGLPFETESRLSSQYKPNYGSPGRLIDRRFALASIDRNALRIGLDRMQLLGFKIDFMQNGIYEPDSEFMSYFNRLATIPKEDFTRHSELLNAKGVFFNERYLGERYSEKGEKARFRHSWGAELLLQTLETGNVPNQLESQLRAAAKIHEVSDGMVALPFDCLGDFTENDLEALATIIEHEVASLNKTEDIENYYRTLNNTLTLNKLKIFSESKVLPILGLALNSGMSLENVFGDRYGSTTQGDWIRGYFSKGLHEGSETIQERAEKLNSYMFSQEYPYVATLRELYSHEGWSFGPRPSEISELEMMRRRADVIQKVIEIISACDINTRIEGLMNLDDNYSTRTWMPENVFSEVKKTFSNQHGGSDFDHFRQITALLLCKNEGQVLMDVIAHIPDKTKIPSKILEKYIETQPDLLAKYHKLRLESENSSWTDAIPDSQSFWNENLSWLISLEEKGINSPDLLLFRRLSTNINVREMIQDTSLSKGFFDALKETIGLNESNITYQDKKSLRYVIETSLTNSANNQFFKTLLAIHPREFTATVSCIRQGYGSINISNPETRKMVFQAIDEVGTITPIVLKEYVNEPDVVRRSAFIENVKTAKKRLLSNEPVRQLFSDMPNGEDFLAELITISFPGNELSQVRHDLSILKDRTEDLSGITSRPEGYDSNSTIKAKIAYLKEDKKLNRDLLDYLKKLLPKPIESEEFISTFNEAVIKLFRGAGLYHLDQFRVETPIIISVLSRDSDVRDVRKMLVDQSQASTVTQFLGRIGEVIGVYFKDNFASRLEVHIERNPDLAKRIIDNCTPKRLDQIEKNLGKIPDQEQAILKPALQNAREATEANVSPTSHDLASIISVMVGTRVLGGSGGLRSLVKKELAKFGYKDSEGTTVAAENQPFKGVVSKNVASFFAKRTAGLCTSADTTLFNRPDHFHINLIRETEIIGNIQGYITEYNDKRTLLFRGLNPSASVVDHTNAAFYCEGMINIIKQFAKDNNLDEVYLSEQLGGWHALTNRANEGVIDYLAPKYLTKENEVEFDFPITESQRISKMYKIDTKN